MLVIVYGIPKSGSTFATEMARELLNAAGHDQKYLRAKYLPESAAQGYVPLADIELAKLCDELPQEKLLVLKTHGSRTEEVRELEASGKLKVIVTYRDPRDAALSAFEAGQKARQKNDTSQSFYKLNTLDDAIDMTVSHIRMVTVGWLSDPGALKLQFGYLTRRATEAAKDMASFIELDESVVNATHALASGKRRVYNFNKGVSGRGALAFTKEQNSFFGQRIGDFLAYCNGNRQPLLDRACKNNPK